MATIDNLTALLGTSLAFPLQIDVSGKVILVSGQDNIEQAIKDRIRTEINTRFYLPQYGSNIESLKGLPQVVSTRLASLKIKEALAEEKRIIVRNIDVLSEEGVLNITINYQLKNSTITDTTTITI